MELEHYGVLGVKWGVRRTQEELGHKTVKTNYKTRKRCMMIAKKLYSRSKKLRAEFKRLSRALSFE